jgi:IS4 transposase
LITDLPRETFTTEHIITAYRLRWQIELMFKEWKSHANLQAFTTEKASIVEGFIWGSLFW